MIFKSYPHYSAKRKPSNIPQLPSTPQQKQQWKYYLKSYKIETVQFVFPQANVIEEWNNYVCETDEDIVKTMWSVEYQLGKYAEQFGRDGCKCCCKIMNYTGNTCYRIQCKSQNRFALHCPFVIQYNINSVTRQFTIKNYNNKHVHYQPELCTKYARQLYKQMLEQKNNANSKFKAKLQKYKRQQYLEKLKKQGYGNQKFVYEVDQDDGVQGQKQGQLQDGQTYENMERLKKLEISQMKNSSNDTDNRKTKNIIKTKQKTTPKTTRKPPKTRKNKKTTKENTNSETNPKNNKYQQQQQQQQEQEQEQEQQQEWQHMVQKAEQHKKLDNNNNNNIGNGNGNKRDRHQNKHSEGEIGANQFQYGYEQEDGDEYKDDVNKDKHHLDPYYQVDQLYMYLQNKQDLQDNRKDDQILYGFLDQFDC